MYESKEGTADFKGHTDSLQLVPLFLTTAYYNIILQFSSKGDESIWEFVCSFLLAYTHNTCYGDDKV